MLQSHAMQSILTSSLLSPIVEGGATGILSWSPEIENKKLITVLKVKIAIVQ